MYDAVDKIVCVSRECADSFLSVYPQGNDRTTYLENLIDANAISAKAKGQTDKVFAEYAGLLIEQALQYSHTIIFS